MLEPGTQIGRYEIQRRLGRGGMGTVYVAHDPVLGRMVAIKVFLGDLDLPDASDRFAREARSAAALNHTNIVTVHDYGDFASQPYIVMEYVQGETLAAVIGRKAPITTAEKLRWLEELCAGVAYAHRVGVIHRDIKPTNLVLDRSGRLKILDFGIARMLGTLSSSATALIGTPGYMSPEQILGGTIDHRSDLFSIGVVSYELLSYAEAFPGDTIPTITHRILSEDPVPLSRLNAELNPELVAVIDQALKKSATERFADAESFAAAISRVRRQLEGVAGPEVWPAPVRRGITPTSGVVGSGTDAALKRLADAAAVTQLTPPPDLRRAGRDELSRRRTGQIEASLEQARTLLHRGDLEAALEACVQALMLDDTRADALELEQTIKAASARRRAGALLDEAREEIGKGALTAAQGLLQQARALGSDASAIKQLERDLRLARVEQERLRQRAQTVSKTLDAAERALKSSEIESALALAREALELDRDSERARSIEAEAMRQLDVDGSGTSLETIPPTILSRVPAGRPSGRQSAAGAASAAPTVIVEPKSRTDARASPRALLPASVRPKKVIATVRAFAASVRADLDARPKRERQIAGWGIIAVVLAAVVVSTVVLMPRPATPTGTLIIDAVPWASIAAIETEDGTSQSLPPQASTPMALDVPIGKYRIRLVGPPPESESRLVPVEVRAGAVISVPSVQFKTLTPEEYFEQYLTPPATETGIETSTPAVTVTGTPSPTPPAEVIR